MRAGGAAHTHTLKGLSSRLGRRPALCPGCRVLQRDGVVLHCMKPRLHLGSDWTCKITANPPPPLLLSANPLLPEGFSLHILPADYHHCQSWLLHSSCCPHSGSGANLTRLRGGRKLSHTARRSRAAARKEKKKKFLPGFSRNLHRAAAAAALQKEPLCWHSFPSGFPPWYCLNNIQSYKWSEQGHSCLLPGSSSSAQNRQWRFPCRPARAALCRCFLWAESGQSAAVTVQKVTLGSHLVWNSTS